MLCLGTDISKEDPDLLLHGVLAGEALGQGGDHRGALLAGGHLGGSCQAKQGQDSDKELHSGSGLVLYWVSIEVAYIFVLLSSW